MLTWASVVPVDCTVQFKAGLEPGLPWQDLPGHVALPGRDGTMSATHAAPPAVERLYRIKAENSPLR